MFKKFTSLLLICFFVFGSVLPVLADTTSTGSLFLKWGTGGSTTVDPNGFYDSIGGYSTSGSTQTFTNGTMYYRGHNTGGTVTVNWTFSSSVQIDNFKPSASRVSTTTLTNTFVDNTTNDIALFNWIESSQVTASYNLTVHIPDTTPPAEVNNIIWSNPDSTSVKLSWSDPADSDFDHVNIFEGSTSLATVSKGVQTYTITGLQPSSNHTYTFKTVDTTGNVSAGKSVSVSVPAPDTTPPGEVSSLSASVTDNTVKLSWVNPSDTDFTKVQIYRGSTLIYTTTVTDTNYIDTGLAPNTTYTYKLQTVDKTGNTSTGATIQATTTGVPVPPSGITGTIGDSIINVSWNPVSNANPSVQGYNVYVSNNKVNNSLITGTSFAVTGLNNGLTYSVSVTAVNASGESSHSTPANFTPVQAVDTTPPPVPVISSISPLNHELDIQWGSVSASDLAGYNVYLDGSKVNSSLIGNTIWKALNLINGQSYVVQVSSVDTHGNESALSNPISATPSGYGVPDVQSKYSLSDIASGVSSWFGSIWLILAFSISIPLVLWLTYRVKELFLH